LVYISLGNGDFMPVLSWIGKDKVVNHHLDVPFRTIERLYSYDEKGQHAEDNGSENMIIHGDNLEALKALLPKYEGKIDCIYIDPPYNTGNQKWVYNDNVNDPTIKKWLGEVVGDDDEDLSKRDKWLCMMYPRLRLLWKLLSPDGAILISINNYAFSDLKAICDEIFGPRNFVETFIWYINGHTDNQDDITSVHEYILCYAKERINLHINDVVDPNTPEDSKILNSFAENSITKNGFKNPPSEICLPKGFPCEVEFLKMPKHEHVDKLIEEATAQGYITREMTRKYRISYPARIDDMQVENYALKEECRVYSGWMNKGKLLQFIKNGFKPIDDNGTQLKFYLSKNGVIYYRRDGRKNHYIQSVLENMGTTETNKYMLESMGITFDYPKPVKLIEYLLSIFVKDKSIVLDSFAGSGTTAHAVMNLNKKGRECKYILIEMMDYAEECTAKRVKSVIDGYGSGKEHVVGLSGSFSFYRLGEPIFIDGYINESIDEIKIKEYIYYTETKKPYIPSPVETTLLGVYFNTAYYFNYSKTATTILDHAFLKTVKTKAEAYVIYADICNLSESELDKYHITFKKIPRDIRKF